MPNPRPHDGAGGADDSRADCAGRRGCLDIVARNGWRGIDCSDCSAYSPGVDRGWR